MSIACRPITGIPMKVGLKNSLSFFQEASIQKAGSPILSLLPCYSASSHSCIAYTEDVASPRDMLKVAEKRRASVMVERKRIVPSHESIAHFYCR